MICEHFHWTLTEHDAQPWVDLQIAWAIVQGLGRGRNDRRT